MAADENIFLNPGAQLAGEVEAIVERLAAASGVLPASTQADSESYYACADGQSVDRTQSALLLRTGAVCVLARALGWHGSALTALRIRQIHEGIFLPVFGAEQTLGFRTPPERGEHRIDDGVIYPIWVVDGPGRPPRTVPRHGVVANQVLRRVEEACRDYELAVSTIERNADGTSFLSAMVE